MNYVGHNPNYAKRWRIPIEELMWFKSRTCGEIYFMSLETQYEEDTGYHLHKMYETNRWMPVWVSGLYTMQLASKVYPDGCESALQAQVVCYNHYQGRLIA